MVQDGEGRSETGAPEVKRARRYFSGLRTLIALVACCALVMWAWRRVWESRDPTLSEFRSLQGRAVRALLSRQASERLTAIHELERLSFNDTVLSIGPLTRALGDEDSEVRSAAADALGRLGAVAVRTGAEDEAVRAATMGLVGALKDPQASMRIAAARAIGSIASAEPGAGAPTPIDTKAVIAALSEALYDQDAAVRGAAIVALATSADRDNPPAALAKALTDESAENRKRTVDMIWRQFRGRLDSWIPSLIDMAEHDPDSSVREDCSGALQLIGPGAITAAAVPALVKGLGSRERAVQTGASILLGKLGKQAEAAIPLLLRELTELIDRQGAGVASAKAEDEWPIAAALGRIAPGSASSEEVIEVLCELVQSGDCARKREAAWALGRFGSAAAAAIPPLIRMAKEVDTPRDQEAAAEALSLIAVDTPAADQVVTALMAVLESKSGAARVAAIEGLVRFGPNAKSAIPKMRALRDDPDGDVKRAAADAVAKLEGVSTP